MAMFLLTALNCKVLMFLESSPTTKNKHSSFILLVLIKGLLKDCAVLSGIPVCVNQSIPSAELSANGPKYNSARLFCGGSSCFQS